MHDCSIRPRNVLTQHGIPIIIACTKAIDDITDLVGACTSELGDIVKGNLKEKEWTDGIIQMLTKKLLKMCVSLVILLHFFLVLIA
jgi:hypothetical protein